MSPLPVHRIQHDRLTAGGYSGFHMNATLAPRGGCLSI